MALNLKRAVVDFLKDRAEQKFTARQIAEWLFETFPEESSQSALKRSARPTSLAPTATAGSIRIWSAWTPPTDDLSH